MVELNAETLNIRNDPHHSNVCRWTLVDGVFYHQVGINKKWQKVKRVNATPNRILMLAELVNGANE